MQEPLSTTEEVSKYLRVDPVTVRKLVNRGELRAYRVGGEFRFKVTDVDAYMQSQVIRPAGVAEHEWASDQELVAALTSVSRHQEVAIERDQDQYTCRFCGRRNHEVGRMIAGPNGAFICNVCVARASDIIAAEEQREPST